MSILRQPAGFVAAGHCENGTGFNDACTERATEKCDTWEMSVFNKARTKWAGNDPAKLRQMAAMFLAIGCDWDFEAISLALGMSSRVRAFESTQAALKAVKKYCPKLAV